MVLKYILAFTIIALFSGCAGTPSADTGQQSAPPSWYTHLPVRQYEIIGYGSGASLEAAKTEARSDIAKSLVVRIRSEFRADTTATKELLKQNVELHIDEYTDVVLTDAKVIRSKQVSGIFYVALLYENLPLELKIKKAFNGMALPEMPQNSLYRYAFFSKTLKSQFGYIPAYSLFFKNGLYYLHMEEKVFALKKSDLRLFFFEKQSPEVSLAASSKHLHTDDFFHFNIAAKRAGYLSLLQVDEEGRVIVHIDNSAVKGNKNIVYPDLRLYDGLQAGIVNRADKISEQYVAALCSDRIDLGLFEHASRSFTESAEAIRYPQLNKMIGNCFYASTVLQTVRK